jgi:GNAT superfamily N-acetyltransferase
LEHSRPAVEADIPRIAELARMMRDEMLPMRGGAIWVAREAPEEPYDDTYAQALTDPDVSLFVGTIDDVVIGFGTLRIETLRTGDRLGVIRDLFVEPEARGVSVGESIANALVDICRDRQCVGIDATALPGHRATKNFFEDQGFTARMLVMHHTLTSDE